MSARDQHDAIVLMGVPGSGKSYLGKLLQERGIARYRELEPLLRERFGAGDTFRARMQEAGAFVWQSYQEQLAQDGPIPAFESAGVDDRALLEQLEKSHRLAFVHVKVPRALCIERVVSRPVGRNIGHTTDRQRVGRHYDLWYERIFPACRFALTVTGEDAGAAAQAIREFLA